MKDVLKVWMVSGFAMFIENINIDTLLNFVVVFTSLLFTIYKFVRSSKVKKIEANDVKNLLICKDCGKLAVEVVPDNFLACCPDSHYIPLKDYIRRSRID